MEQSPANSVQQKRLFSLAFLPPPNVQVYANQIKQRFAKVYQSKAALKSPPHITLQAPFQWDFNDLVTLENALVRFAEIQTNISIKLDGFSSFPPRVIYLNVEQTSELLNLQKNLSNYLELSLKISDRRHQNRSFTPHLTVAFKDLSPTNFYRAWEEFKNTKVNFNFTVTKLTLLFHHQGRWETIKQFKFSL